MAGLFAELKWRGIPCEMAPEWAKRHVWAGTEVVLEDQIYVFANQLNMIRELEYEVDFIICDSPLPLSLVYGKKESKEFHHLVEEVWRRFDNYNVFLTRTKAYDPKGRLQNEEQARKLDDDIRTLLNVMHIDYHTLVATRELPVALADTLVKYRYGDVVRCPKRGFGQGCVPENNPLSEVCAFCGGAT
jgi:hypothetical protein